MAKVAKIWDGTAWVDLATSVPDLSNYQLKSESGLTFIKKQTIGTAVSSVTVTDAFSATYENYKIVVSGGTASAGLNCHMVLGASATQYYAGLSITTFATGAGSNFAANNLTTWPYVGYFDTNGHRVTIDVLNPFLAKYTTYDGPYIAVNSAGYVAGVHNQNTSYTDFTLSSPGGTVTGGTIYVYGYNKG
jgi:hypothetical protein